MKRPKASHQVDTHAQRVFRNAIPDAWIVRKQDPDYAVDYIVEIVDSEDLTGIQFAVQLKGTGAPRPPLSHKITSQHLVYYYDKYPLPVFLVRISTTTDIGLFSFLQGYIDDGKCSNNWRDKKHVSVRLFEEHRISDISVLREAVKQAQNLMLHLRPGSVPGAIRATQRRLESLDSRFEVAVTGSANGYHADISAKSDVPLNLTFIGKNCGRRMKDFLDGRLVELTAGDFRISGSPLFEKSMQGTGSLVCKQSRSSELRLSPITQDGDSARQDVRIPGNLVGLGSNHEFQGMIADSPLEIRLRLDLSKENPVVDFRLVFHISRWQGHVFQFLPYFEEVNAFMEYACSPSGAKMLFLISGNNAISGRMRWDEDPGGRQVVALLELLSKARYLNERFRLNAVLPTTLTGEYVAAIEEAYDLAKDGRHERSAEGLTITILIDEESLRRLRQEQRKKTTNGPLTFTAERSSIPVLDNHIDMGRVEVQVTRVNCTESFDSLLSKCMERPERKTLTTWTAASDARVLVRRATDVHNGTMTGGTNCRRAQTEMPPRLAPSCHGTPLPAVEQHQRGESQ